MRNGLAVVAELFVALAVCATFVRSRLNIRVSSNSWLLVCFVVATILSYPSRWVGNNYAFFTVVFAAVVAGAAYLNGVAGWLPQRLTPLVFAMIFVGCIAAVVFGEVRWISAFSSMALFGITVVYVSLGPDDIDDREAHDVAFIVACIALIVVELALDMKWRSIAWCSLLTMRPTNHRVK